jgi:hypothetical protein
VAIYKRMISDYQFHFFHLLATAGINYFSQIENNLARIGIGIMDLILPLKKIYL